MEVIRFSTSDGARSAVTVNCSESGPVTFTRSFTLSLVQPNCVNRKAGVLSSRITRCSETTTSSAVTGAPSWNAMPARSLKVNTLPSGLMVQLSAAPPISLLTSSAS